MVNFCPSCGAPLQPGAGFCANCGRGVGGAPPPRGHQGYGQGYGQSYGQSYGQPGGDPEARSKATTALVCSIVGLLCLPIVFSVIGLVKGMSAKERLDHAGEQTGTATAAIVIGIVGLVSGVIVAIGVLARMSL
jgi:hypothetical protein